MSDIEITVSVRVVDAKYGQEEKVVALTRTPRENSGNPRYHAAVVERRIAEAGSEIVAQVAALFGDIRDDLPRDEISKPYADRPLATRTP